MSGKSLCHQLFNTFVKSLNFYDGQQTNHLKNIEKKCGFCRTNIKFKKYFKVYL